MHLQHVIFLLNENYNFSKGKRLHQLYLPQFNHLNHLLINHLHHHLIHLHYFQALLQPPQLYPHVKPELQQWQTDMLLLFYLPNCWK